MPKPADFWIATTFAALVCAACSANDNPGPPGTADAGDAGPDAAVTSDGSVADAGFGPCDPTTGSGCPGDQRCVWLAASDAVQCRNIDS